MTSLNTPLFRSSIALHSYFLYAFCFYHYRSSSPTHIFPCHTFACIFGQPDNLCQFHWAFCGKYLYLTAQITERHSRAMSSCILCVQPALKVTLINAPFYLAIVFTAFSNFSVESEHFYEFPPCLILFWLCVNLAQTLSSI